MRFRRNIERIGEILGYELSKALSFGSSQIKTPLGSSSIDLIANDVVLCSILRAGIPLHNGLLNYFDSAENAFISAYRHHPENSDDFEIIVEYLACPDLKNKTLILADPMLATGRSMVTAFEALKPYGTPKEVHLVSAIVAQEGVEFVDKHFGKDVHLFQDLVMQVIYLLVKNYNINNKKGTKINISRNNSLNHFSLILSI